jgi:hypothetical protein
MEFRYDDNNGDERYAGQSFPATWGDWNGEEWEPSTDGQTLLVVTPGFDGQWSPQFNHTAFGKIVS